MLVDQTVALEAYGEVRDRLTQLLADLDDASGAATTVPGCPAWSVTDTVAHLTGACIDIVDGNLEGVGTTAWADDQVARFSNLGLARLLQRWGEVGPVVQSLAPAFPRPEASQFVFDATLHEQDIRGALGRPGGRDAECVGVGLGFLESALDSFVRSNGLATLALVSPEWTAVAGEGAPSVRVEASRFELLRSFGGRRSTEQFLALPWTGDPVPYLAMFDNSPLELRDSPLVE
ncbi:MAG: maleylpyruvate isomerase family mycothiol-dependent enzyme [Acidimicrobiales bacterium]|jgi:uncharacterized protein (TIGR03083 family)